MPLGGLSKSKSTTLKSTRKSFNSPFKSPLASESKSSDKSILKYKRFEIQNETDKFSEIKALPPSVSQIPKIIDVDYKYDATEKPCKINISKTEENLLIINNDNNKSVPSSKHLNDNDILKEKNQETSLAQNQSKSCKRSIEIKNCSRKAFKSPLLKKIAISKSENINKTSEEIICCLKTKERELETEINKLEKKGFNVEDLDIYIKELHHYNEIKDAAQIVMGRIADLDQITLREVHEHFGAEIKD